MGHKLVFLQNISKCTVHCLRYWLVVLVVGPFENNIVPIVIKHLRKLWKKRIMPITLIVRFAPMRQRLHIIITMILLNNNDCFHIYLDACLFQSSIPSDQEYLLVYCKWKVKFHHSEVGKERNLVVHLFVIVNL